MGLNEVNRDNWSSEVPLCSENGCEIINELLSTHTETLKGFEELVTKKRINASLLQGKEEYLKYIRDEEERVIVKIWKLKNESYG